MYEEPQNNSKWQHHQITHGHNLINNKITLQYPYQNVFILGRLITQKEA
jgi:hypothetical protein